MKLVTLLLGVAIALSTFYRLGKSFSNTQTDHGLRVRIHEDCQTIWFSSRYGDLCENDRLNPPSSFLIAVVEQAFFDGDYCVLMDCSVLCSVRGAIYVGAGGFMGWLISDVRF